MNCEACRGACCESFSLPLIHILTPTSDAKRWVELHGAKSHDGMLSMIEFEVRCRKLTPEGSCSIYQDRPLVCRTYKAGGPDCLATVKARRTPEDYQRIRGEGDPERLA